MAYKIISIGDPVIVDGYRPFMTGGESTIDDVSFRYDKMDGTQYQIVKVNGNWYDVRNGGDDDNPESMWYIEFLDWYK